MLFKCATTQSAAAVTSRLCTAAGSTNGNREPNEAAYRILLPTLLAVFSVFYLNLMPHVLRHNEAIKLNASDIGIRTLYVIRAHSNISVVNDVFQKMQRELGVNNVFLTFDDTLTNWPFGESMRITQLRTRKSPNVLLFNRSECEAVMVGVSQHMQYWDQPALVLFHRHMADISYDYLWRFESDVRCNGDYMECLSGTFALHQDLICSHAPNQNTAGDPGWHWFKISGRLANVTLNQRWGCFTPAVRLSRRAMQLVSDEMGVSSGFLEVFYPTLIAHHGLTMTELPVYDRGYIGLHPEEAVKLLDIPHKDNRLYHPVKDCGSLTITGERITCK